MKAKVRESNLRKVMYYFLAFMLVKIRNGFNASFIVKLNTVQVSNKVIYNFSQGNWVFHQTNNLDNKKLFN